MSRYLDNGEYAVEDEVTLVAADEYAETFDSAAVDTDRGVARLTLDVTAITGTLDVTIQTRKDTDDSWRTVGTQFTQASDVTSERKCFSGLDRLVRAHCVIGTGPATFSVFGELV